MKLRQTQWLSVDSSESRNAGRLAPSKESNPGPYAPPNSTTRGGQTVPKSAMRARLPSQTVAERVEPWHVVVRSNQSAIAGFGHLADR
jgi:hypothetical protein